MLRIYDVIFSLLGLIITLPIFLLFFLFSFYQEGSFIFKQKRVGYKNKTFYLLKIRTMKTTTKNIPTHELNKKTFYFYGSFLRKTKLDELPQLINVIKGEMSLVGPRPCLLTQTELINERNKFKIYLYKPGITGLSQLRKIDMSNPKILAKSDFEMINNYNLSSYFKYIIMTVFGSGYGDRINKQMKKK